MTPRARLDREQARAVDRFATEALALPSLLLMENAGRNAAEVVLGLCRGRRHARVVVLAGTGNNGGDGLVVARHVARAGVPVRVLLCGERARLTADAAVQLAIVGRMGIAVAAVRSDAAARRAAARLARSDVVVDALLGTGFQGDVRAPMATLILALDEARQRGTTGPIVALDLPSGLDADSGRPSNATVRADVTVTFVAEKKGFARRTAAPWLGEVLVRDIGIGPREVARALAAEKRTRRTRQTRR